MTDDEMIMDAWQRANKISDDFAGARLDVAHTAIAIVLADLAVAAGIDEETFLHMNFIIANAATENFRTMKAKRSMQ